MRLSKWRWSQWRRAALTCTDMFRRLTIETKSFCVFPAVYVSVSCSFVLSTSMPCFRFVTLEENGWYWKIDFFGVYVRKPLWDVQSKNYHNREVARKLGFEIYFLKLLCFSLYGLILCRMYQNVSGPIIKYWKNFCACSSSIGNKVWNSPHFCLSSKIGFTQSFLSSSNNNFFNKGFSNNNNNNNNSCSTILMHSTRTGVVSVVERVQYDHTCAVWPHAQQCVVDRWVRRVRQCKKSAKNRFSVTIRLQDPRKI